MNRLSIALALVSSLALAACGGSSAQQGGTTSASHEGCGCEHCDGTCDAEHHEHAEASASATVVPPGEAHVGDTTTCPISGETFVVTESSPHAEYEGRTYYFCCPGCAGRFQADPAHYAHPAATTTAPSST